VTEPAPPPAVGVGPHPLPWPDDPRLDPDLLAHGDRRNVVDRYRYWRHEAIVADLDGRRHDFHVAIENWRHDLNIGTVVRAANAFLAREVHIVGNRRWNRRGAMVTDRYQHIRHHPTPADLAAYCREQDLPIVAVDNLPGAVPLETTALPRRCLLLFGQEGPGLSTEAREVATLVCSIAQYGSTRSINAGVAAGKRQRRAGEKPAAGHGEGRTHNKRIDSAGALPDFIVPPSTNVALAVWKSLFQT